ncbi:putative enoyl-CoA hydratase echA8 [Clostridium homopropionicum DSM 5847]|uniref:short-chain-enoyl-CoA hydratase n=1 Tax=Clostridium homopropionicum DSM 5847 TaxID=1121318 RepID=A0A0L6Z647_9CLOT|nr:enoyl-CoA hydratase-related protein [Clostridium homopropionicum]KOA18440.1 putative enoyl-CoA hydratase echA8 [Clostridium homopropionicum DSM 5847]SFF66791.1 enoyl-CoA hydratase [Clostridium homopropionicum]
MKKMELKDLELKNIKLEIDGPIAIVTMNRPKALNALNNQTLEELNVIIDGINEDKDILGVIITGEGKGFVAGADIAQMKPYKAEDGRNYAEFAQSTFNKIEGLGKPVIAAVNGYALGGGCELSMSCDLRIASEKAIFGQPEVNLGVIPCFGGTQRLPRLIGSGRAKELIFTARMVKAEEALHIGLVNMVVSSDELLNEAKKVMTTIISKAPVAVRYSKIAINKGADMDLNNALEFEKDLAALTFASEDKDEGMTAFLEKREAKFLNK